MGIFDNFLKKTGKTPEEEEASEQAKIDASLKSGEELYEPQATAPEEESRPSARAGADASQLMHLQAQVDTMSAQIQAIKEQRAIYDEKFSRVNESVGELRALMLDAEKDSQEIKINAEKAVSLIDAVQPDKLLGEVRKTDAKLDEVKARNEKLETLLAQATDDVKELKSKLVVFGTSEETLLKLQDEVRRELQEIKKSESVIQRHSEKVEAIFAEVEKDFANYKRLSEQVQAGSDALRELVRDFDSLRVRTEGFATKKEFNELKNSTDEKVIEADRQLKEIGTAKEQLRVDAQTQIEQIKITVAEKLSKIDETLSQIQATYDKTPKRVSDAQESSKGIRKQLDEHTRLVEDKFQEFNDNVLKFENRYDGLENELAGLETRLYDDFIQEGKQTRTLLTKIQSQTNAQTEKYDDLKKRVQHSEKQTASLLREFAKIKTKLEAKTAAAKTKAKK